MRKLKNAVRIEKTATISSKFSAKNPRELLLGIWTKLSAKYAVAQRDFLAIFYAKFQLKFMRTPASACASWIAKLRVDTGKPEILEIRGPIESVG
jgi:hypothetical protein